MSKKPLTQSELYVMVQRLPKGKAFKISQEDMRSVAGGSLSGLDLWGGVRRSDVEEFVAIIQRNWEIKVTEDLNGHNWTISRPNEEKRVWEQQRE